MTVGARVSGIPTAEQALVVGRVVLLVEAGREAKVGQLDVAGAVDQDVVGFDITVGAEGSAALSRVVEIT